MIIIYLTLKTHTFCRCAPNVGHLSCSHALTSIRGNPGTIAGMAALLSSEYVTVLSSEEVLWPLPSDD